jgi:hypothetical protein
MARRLSRLPVAWSDDVVTDAQPPSCQDKPHQIKPNRTEPNRTEPNRTEPNRTKGALHDIGGLLLISRSFGNGPRSKRPISKGLSTKGPISGGGAQTRAAQSRTLQSNAHLLSSKAPSA